MIHHHEGISEFLCAYYLVLTLHGQTYLGITIFAQMKYRGKESLTSNHQPKGNQKLKEFTKTFMPENCHIINSHSQ